MARAIDYQQHSAHRLLQWGMALFLLGLLTGFAIPALANPRMGLTSHLEGIMNGMFLVILGLVWTRLRVGERALRIGYWLALFGAFTNWITTLVAGMLGAGGSMMPIAAGGHEGTPAAEALIAAGLLSLSFAMLSVLGIVLWGLRGGPQAGDTSSSIRTVYPQHWPDPLASSASGESSPRSSV
jgi:(hydroxyamino)benzene mutase